MAHPAVAAAAAAPGALHPHDLPAEWQDIAIGDDVQHINGHGCGGGGPADTAATLPFTEAWVRRLLPNTARRRGVHGARAADRGTELTAVGEAEPAASSGRPWFRLPKGAARTGGDFVHLMGPDAEAGGSAGVRARRGAGGTTSTRPIPSDAPSLVPSAPGDDHHGPPAGSKTMAVVIAIVKAYVGSGVFGLPYAFREGGMALAPLGLVAISVVSNGCVLLLVDCVNTVGSPDVRTFGQVGRAAFGAMGSAVVNSNLILTQCGFCAVYIIYIGDNISRMLTDALGQEVDEAQLVFVLLLPALCAMCSLKSLKGLTPLALVGSALVFAAVLSVVIFSWPQLTASHDPGERGVRPIAAAESLPIFFSMAVYCFEGIGLALPIRNSMDKPANFTRVWLASMSAVTGLYVLFGCYGYAAYGKNTPSSITNTLPRDSQLSLLVKLGVCGCLFLTFPMMMFPVFEICEAKWPLKALLEHKRIEAPVRIGARALLVLLVTIFATVVPDFGLVIALVGALGCNAVAFILPCMFHLKLCWHKLSRTAIVRNVSISLFGTLAMIVCTLITLDKIRRGVKTH